MEEIFACNFYYFQRKQVSWMWSRVKELIAALNYSPCHVRADRGFSTKRNPRNAWTSALGHNRHVVINSSNDLLRNLEIIWSNSNFLSTLFLTNVSKLLTVLTNDLRSHFFFWRLNIRTQLFYLYRFIRWKNTRRVLCTYKYITLYEIKVSRSSQRVFDVNAH